MTDGGAAANGTKEIRRCETDKVAALYPNIRYTHLGFADMGISSYNEEQMASIIRVVRRLKPSIIAVSYTHLAMFWMSLYDGPYLILGYRLMLSAFHTQEVS